ncbi:MAG: VOC family protein [Opitutus sp.]
MTLKPAKALSRKSTTGSLPKGFTSVTPQLICAGASDAIAFYRKAFGATELSRVTGSTGKLMYAEIQLGNSRIMLVDEMPEWGALGPLSLKGSSVTIHLYVEDVERCTAKAVAAGAKLVMPVEERFWGDRQGLVQDPFGHKWSIATRVKNVSPEEAQKASIALCRE